MIEPKGFLIAKTLAVTYLQDFTQKIKACADIEQYYELVTSVLVLHELICSQFKELYEIDSAQGDFMLIELNVVAKTIAAEVLEEYLKEKEKNLN